MVGREALRMTITTTTNGFLARANFPPPETAIDRAPFLLPRPNSTSPFAFHFYKPFAPMAGMSAANSAVSSTFSSCPSSATHFPNRPAEELLAASHLPVGQQLSQCSSGFDDFCYGSEGSSSIQQHHQATRHYQQQKEKQHQPQQHRSSWTNLLVDMVDGGRMKKGGQNFNEAPPPYDQLLHCTAHRQGSSASAGTHSSSGGGPFSVSKGSFTFLHFAEPSQPPFPQQPRQPSVTGRGSAQSMSQGGRISTGTGSSRRELQPRRKKRDRMQELRNLWAHPSCRLCCLAMLVLLLVALIVVAVLSSQLTLPKHLEFAWVAPEQLRTEAAAGQPAAPSHGRLDVGQFGQQVRLELNGALPFRSNFLSILDFRSNKVAILDMSLRSGGQRNLICFVVDLDRQNVPDMESLLRAAKNGAERKNQLHGWEESWLWMPQPLSQSPVFQPEVAECKDARWVQLVRTGNDQKGQKCTECFDFCLPDWGIQRDAIRDEQYLNILRRLCFSLFVPEWRPFAQSLGWQQHTHDFEQFYRRQQQQELAALGNQQQQGQQQLQGPVSGGTTETKWISLQTPQQQQPAGNAMPQWPVAPQSPFGVGPQQSAQAPLPNANRQPEQQQQVWPWNAPQLPAGQPQTAGSSAGTWAGMMPAQQWPSPVQQQFTSAQPPVEWGRPQQQQQPTGNEQQPALPGQQQMWLKRR